jgi:hypothetical protein
VLTQKCIPLGIVLSSYLSLVSISESCQHVMHFCNNFQISFEFNIQTNSLPTSLSSFYFFFQKPARERRHEHQHYLSRFCNLLPSYSACLSLLVGRYVRHPMRNSCEVFASPSPTMLTPIQPPISAPLLSTSAPNPTRQ